MSIWLDKIEDEEKCKELLSIDLYSKLPCITPVVGKEYHNTRVLLVCKNFGVPNLNDEANQLNEKCQKWHGSSKDILDKFLKLPMDYKTGEATYAVRDWLQIREHLGDQHPGWVWHKFAGAIIESNLKPFGDIPNHEKQDQRSFVYKHLAFMNYLTRPTTSKVGNVLEQLDKDKSYEVFIETVNKLKPAAIFFFGKWFEYHEKLMEYKEKSNSGEHIKVANFYSPSATEHWHENSERGKQFFLEELARHMDNQGK